MESSVLSTVFLPLALFVIMLGMGLGLTLDDFKRVITAPFAVLVGLVAQLVLLPLVGLGLAYVSGLSPELMVGLMIIAACPGGPTSNMLSYLARGDVALSITLTAVCSLITIFSIPLIINGAMQLFLAETSELRLPFFETMMKMAVITLVPVSLGMLLHANKPALSAAIEKQVKWLSIAFLALIIVGLLVQEREQLPSYFLEVGLFTLLLNVATMVLGVGLGWATQLGRARTTSITVEVGIQNGTLAITLALSPLFLNNPTMSIPAVVYSILMFATGGLFAWWRGRTVS